MVIWKSISIFLAAARAAFILPGCRGQVNTGLEEFERPFLIKDTNLARSKNEVPVIQVIVALCDRCTSAFVEHKFDGT
ncbi:MAG: hypothetical protein OEM82_12465 [Acidobacteriota bacterium]|nr:hypothetical protein [Acidobacteriota bacterium]